MKEMAERPTDTLSTRRAARWRRFPTHPGLWLSLAALLLYLLTLSNDPSADSLIYALDIESGRTSALIDPTHLLLHPLGLAFYRVWQWLGWEGGAWRPLQVLNALGGAAAVAVLYALAARLGGSRRLALLTAAGFAVSGGTWLLSVDAEFVTIPLAVALLVLWGVMRAGDRAREGYRDSLWLAAGTALAALTYASGLGLALAVVTGYLALDESATSRRRRAAAYLGTLALLGAPLLVLALGVGSAGSYLGALLNPAGYAAWRPSDVLHGGYAFLRSLFLYPGLSMNDSTAALLAGATRSGRLRFGGYYGLVAVIALLPLLLAWIRRRRLWHHHRRDLLVLSVWSILYGAFAVFWVPGDVTFWMPVLAAWWLLVALALNAWRAQPPSGRTARIGGVFAVLPALLLVANGVGVMLPRHDVRRSVGREAAQSIMAQTAAADLIVVNGLELASLQLAYFADRRLLYVHPAGEVESLRQRVAQESLARPGGRVYLVDACALDCEEWRGLITRLLPSGSTPAWRTARAVFYEWSP